MVLGWVFESDDGDDDGDDDDDDDGDVGDDGAFLYIDPSSQ